MADRRRAGRHVRAVRKDLLRVAPADRAGGLAALALTLARTLDEAEQPDGLIFMAIKDFTAVSREFHAVLGTLAKLQAPVVEANPVDEIAQKRAQRRADAAG